MFGTALLAKEVLSHELSPFVKVAENGIVFPYILVMDLTINMGSNDSRIIICLRKSDVAVEKNQFVMSLNN